MGGAANSDLAHVGRPLLHLVHRLTGLETTFITHIDWAGQVQEIVIARNTSDELVVPEGAWIPWQDTTCRRVLLSGTEQTTDVPNDFPGSVAAEQLHMQTYLAVPILDDDDRVLGTVCGASRRVVPQDDETVERVRLIAAALASQMRAHVELHLTRTRAEHAELESRTAFVQAEDLARKVHDLEALAMTDPLTGLPNRRSFMAGWEEVLARSARHGDPIAVLLLDIDHFKAVNDTRGHGAGDAMLVTVAGMLRRAARAGDLAGRMGGDEFVLALPHSGSAGAQSLARRIAADLGSASPPCTLSVGISTSSTTPRQDLLEAADKALYLAKRAGRNRAEVWEGEVSSTGRAPGSTAAARP